VLRAAKNVCKLNFVIIMSTEFVLQLKLKMIFLKKKLRSRKKKINKK
jgi:hypothetical protein